MTMTPEQALFQKKLQKFMDFYKQRAAAAAAAPPALATATSNDLAAMGVELNTEGNLFSGGGRCVRAEPTLEPLRPDSKLLVSR
jgi:hypothetical protein